MSNADKRKSRDDSELLASGLPTNFGDGAHRPSGLKGKLRRALSLSAAQSIEPVVGGEDEDGPEGSAAGKKKRRALFNAKLNASTDNISLSSTMSSASVVIRKLGSIGKLARRNSIAGITSVFKGKKGKDEDEGLTVVLYPHRRIRIDELITPQGLLTAEGKPEGSGDGAASPTKAKVHEIQEEARSEGMLDSKGDGAHQDGAEQKGGGPAVLAHCGGVRGPADPHGPGDGPEPRSHAGRPAPVGIRANAFAQAAGLRGGAGGGGVGAALSDAGLGFTPHIRGKRPNVLRVAQPRFFFSSLCSEK